MGSIWRRDDHPTIGTVEPHVEPIEASGVSQNRVPAVLLESDLRFPGVFADPELGDREANDPVTDVDRIVTGIAEGMNLRAKLDAKGPDHRER